MDKGTALPRSVTVVYGDGTRHTRPVRRAVAKASVAAEIEAQGVAGVEYEIRRLTDGMTLWGEIEVEVLPLTRELADRHGLYYDAHFVAVLGHAYAY